VADVFREHGPQFLQRHRGTLRPEQRRVLSDIVRCRTAALGGHTWRCDSCGHEEISYNSCRNRHCPKCQASARAEWLDREAEYLLDVEYFHVVFTLPADLGPLALRNKRQIYGALFGAAAETLHTIARDPKHLGAEIGFLIVLHTWGQNLQAHPHVHCVVPGGGLSRDGREWIPSRKGFFLPVRVLSRLFRRKFLGKLEHLYTSQNLSLTGEVASLKDAGAWKALLDSLRRHEWVVYSKPPFGGPEQVLKYLARYTHRVAISNQRLLSLKDGKVQFRWKDYAHGGKRRVMTLQATEFIRRFLLHVLPKGFVRIRHYGFLSNRSRKEKLPLARRLLADAAEEPLAGAPQAPDNDQQEEPANGRICPRCNTGRLVIVDDIPPTRCAPTVAFLADTS
jgi:hypothetical protein